MNNNSLAIFMRQNPGVTAPGGTILDAYRITIVRPRTEFHKTGLLVEWKVFDVNFAKGFVDGWRFPHHFPRVV